MNKLEGRLEEAIEVGKQYPMGMHTVYDRVTHAWVDHDGSGGVIHAILDHSFEL